MEVVNEEDNEEDDGYWRRERRMRGKEKVGYTGLMWKGGGVLRMSGGLGVYLDLS